MMAEKINIGGLYIHLVDIKDACNIVEDYIDKNKNAKSKKPIMVQAVNADTIIKANLYKDIANISNKADLALADGMPIVWISKFMKKRLKERVAGPDFFDYFNRISNEKGYSYYFLGATDDVMAKIISRMKSEYSNIQITGYYSPPFSDMDNELENENICNKISKLNPDVVWVGLGCPKQEKWIVNNKNRITASMIMGIGAVFQFYAGTLKRAPKFMQRTGLEWFYRLLKEPRRLFKRYIVNGPRFIHFIIKDKNQLI